MKKDKEKAIILRKSGQSYSEIRNLLNIPKSTLSKWFKEQEWSKSVARENIKRIIQKGTVRLVVMNSIKGNRLKAIYEEAKKEAISDFEILKYHPLFITGLSLYWSHGNKSSKSQISFSSSDSRKIRVFYLFLNKVCGLDKIKTRLILKKGIDEDVAKSFWIEKGGLKYEFFGKTTFICKGNNVNLDQEYRGVCNIGLTSAYLKCKIMKWIDLLSSEITEENYLI